jgi:probable F420-dependent oxidoreductase
MQFSFPLPHTTRLKAIGQAWEGQITGADQTRLAQRADQLGFDMLAVPEHFLVPDAHVDLSGPHYFHATAAQGYLAGATERIRINSSLTVLPLHHPVVLAKALSTIDWMSSGRITATFGVGWDQAEYDLMGLSFHDRGKRADEYLEAMIELWTSDHPTFAGEFVSFSDAAFEPKPVQQPHLPIWIGGEAPAVLRRAARFATGWMPFLTTESELPAKLDYLRSQPGFRPEGFEVSFSLGTASIGEGHVALDNPDAPRPGDSAEHWVDRIGRLAEIGVTITSVPVPAVAGPEQLMDHAQWVMEEIKPKLP